MADTLGSFVRPGDNLTLNPLIIPLFVLVAFHPYHTHTHTHYGGGVVDIARRRLITKTLLTPLLLFRSLRRFTFGGCRPRYCDGSSGVDCGGGGGDGGGNERTWAFRAGCVKEVFA